MIPPNSTTAAAALRLKGVALAGLVAFCLARASTPLVSAAPAALTTQAAPARLQTEATLPAPTPPTALATLASTALATPASTALATPASAATPPTPSTPAAPAASTATTAGTPAAPARATTAATPAAPTTPVATAAEAKAPPAVGERAPDFTLATVAGEKVRLHEINARSPVVLVFLRGWPGYQCPLCTRQVQDFIAHAAAISARGARVVLVYPGPAPQLVAHAQDFLRDKAWPADFTLVLDPDYAATLAYQLRWDAPKETAYPATFVLERGAVIRFAQISRTHGDRVSAERVLAALE